MKYKLPQILFLGTAALLVSGLVALADPLIKSGEKVAFLGDSITAQGAGSPGGYVQLVISGLKANNINVAAIPAGIGGHKSNDMLQRIDKDVIEKKPDWMTLSCGVNDVWHGARGVPFDAYKANITEIVNRAEAAGIKVMILTSTMIQEDPSQAPNVTLEGYNDFLRSLAVERKIPLADLASEMRTAIAAKEFPQPDGNYLTVDGVHMNPLGNEMMAFGVLKAFGLNDAQLAAAKEAWQDIPGANEIPASVRLSLRQYKALIGRAVQERKNLRTLMNELLLSAVQEGSRPIQP